MTTITQIDKAAAQRLSEATRAALKAVADEYGVSVEVGGGRFDPTAGTFAPKITFKVEGSAEQEFRSYAPMFGLEPDDWHAQFEVQGRPFIITGLATRSRTRPILAESGSKTYKFTPGAVKRALGREVEAWEI